jgi:hypothetical protein
VVHETDSNGVPNELYDAAQLYLGARCLALTPALHLPKTQGSSDVVASLPDDQTAWDTFCGVRVLWAPRRAESNDAYSPSGLFSGGGGGWSGGFIYPGGGGQQQRCPVLQFPRRRRDTYIPHVLDVAARLGLSAYHSDDGQALRRRPRPAASEVEEREHVAQHTDVRRNFR